MSQVTVEVECKDCKGTGLYRGFAEPKGIAVVCLKCDGTGKVSLTYTPFTERKRRDDVNTVRRSAGTFIGAAVGPTGGSISYEEFLAGKMPSE